MRQKRIIIFYWSSQVREMYLLSSFKKTICIAKLSCLGWCPPCSGWWLVSQRRSRHHPRHDSTISWDWHLEQGVFTKTLEILGLEMSRANILEFCEYDPIDGLRTKPTLSDCLYFISKLNSWFGINCFSPSSLLSPKKVTYYWRHSCMSRPLHFWGQCLI